MDLDLDDCEALADFWLFMKDDAAEERIAAYVERGRRFADEPVEWLRILYMRKISDSTNIHLLAPDPSGKTLVQSR